MQNPCLLWTIFTNWSSSDMISQAALRFMMTQSTSMLQSCNTHAALWVPEVRSHKVSLACEGRAKVNFAPLRGILAPVTPCTLTAATKVEIVQVPPSYHQRSSAAQMMQICGHF
ncbi:hypothetical protein HaLaN_00355 [Haematococcus lacustris]|uniref:Uncharacterized protein n=1 Tax=Haematococcus lacustris TaxID=44745 RepID=A0A699Y6Q1_HAELA|nr:hypothetical protein HaLaN_00355 [Haematococcus lacustris]